MFNQDILDCIVLSSSLKIPFLNSEVLVSMKYELSGLIDFNVFFYYLEKKCGGYGKNISNVIFKMKEFGYDFISFNAQDLFNVTRDHGVEGLKPFLKMGINADYLSFVSVYIDFLKLVYNDRNEEEFLELSRLIIDFMDSYLKKTQYYVPFLIRKFPSCKKSLLRQFHNPTIVNIMYSVSSCSSIEEREKKRYIYFESTDEIDKIRAIGMAFIQFLTKFIEMFEASNNDRERYIKFYKECSTVNSESDIDYILKLLLAMKENDVLETTEKI